MYLVLFDIDGTLLRGQGVGALAMERAGRALLGPSFSLAGIDFGGALDPWIFREAVTRMGRSDAHEHHGRFRDAYLLELARGLELGEGPLRVIPGVESAVRQVAAMPDTTIGLLTGNYAPAVPLKLRAAGIDPAQFVLGAFGDDAPTRPGLVPVAIEQWRARGAQPDPRRVVVIGDTPRDVDCARKNGCRSIAVATGKHSFEQLRATDADLVVSDLSALHQQLTEVWGNRTARG